MGALAGWGRRHTRVHAARPAVVCVIELIWKRAVERVRVSASRDSCSRWRLPGRPNSDSGAACVVAVSLRLAPTRRISRFDGNTVYHHTDRSGANPVNLPVSKALGPSRRGRLLGQFRPIYFQRAGAGAGAKPTATPRRQTVPTRFVGMK